MLFDNKYCRFMTPMHLRSILKALHAEEINLQSARKLIDLIEDNPLKDVNEVSSFELINT